jgi:hypothetical protein
MLPASLCPLICTSQMAGKTFPLFQAFPVCYKINENLKIIFRIFTNILVILEKQGTYNKSKEISQTE